MSKPDSRRIICNVRQREKYSQRDKTIGRVERTLKLIVFLNDWHTIKECSAHIGVSERSIQRYFNMLIDLGFIVETNYGMFYASRIANVASYFSCKATD